MTSGTSVLVEGRPLTLSNLDKVLYPETGYTKAHMIEYYNRIAAVLLPHFKNRPITLKRYPDGVEGGFFYEKRCPSHRPRWMKTYRVEKGDGSEPPIRYCNLGTLPALLWAVNLAALEFHSFLHVNPRLAEPQSIVFDLDPGEGVGIQACATVALELKERLKRLKMEAFPKTSGSKGLQVYIPLNSGARYAQTRAFAHTIALQIERDAPGAVVTKITKALRKGKVFIDWSQNHSKKTTVSVYSLRARPHPSVSTPLGWEEVAEAARGEVQLFFTPEEVLQRTAKRGDLFEPLLTLRQRIAKLEN